MTHEHSPWRRAVVVEDEENLALRVRDHLVARGLWVQLAPSAGAGVDLIRQVLPDLVILDYKLPDGDARGVLEQLAELSPWPTFVAMSGQAEPLDTFELARLGIHAYLQKPFTPEALDEALRRAREQAVPLVPALRTAVGKMAIHDVEELARGTMVKEALARSGGSRTGAARLLQVSRQLLQHILRGIRD
ncbi:MAG TPA: response regulator [Polyangiaceae bacterium]|jgi:DNA-binding NtrC family response regulator|nr:response regulator [Polyangiaceae bacterium]